jgi:ribosome-associated toxin RatA of RatAB toxin-antitoxin module
MVGTLRTLDGISAAALGALLADGPLIRVHCLPEGKPRAASSAQLVQAPAEVVWGVLADVTRFPSFVHMVDSVKVLPPGPAGEERVQVNLRFKISLFSARFDFLARVKREPDRWVELAYESGKVRDLAIRLEVAPVDAERSALLCVVGFDQTSLGWLVKIFIRHHPEIDWGVHAGSTLSIAASIRQAAEAQCSP